MCTAISFNSKTHLFGRSLDLEKVSKEEVTVTPRRFPLYSRHLEPLEEHYAIIGMATVIDDYPLYYDATNEYGLSMAGLNFVGNAIYLPPDSEKTNVAPFEFVPFVLSRCKDLKEARSLLKCLNLTDEPFSAELPLSPLHFIISDSTGSIVVEPMAYGIEIYDNPVGVLTNNPPFPYHLYNLSGYQSLSPEPPEAKITKRLTLPVYSNGMGAIGLPGDYSSASRFVKASFVLHNARKPTEYGEEIEQFFHVLESVYQVEGCVITKAGLERTQYVSCVDTKRGIYYYKTYYNSGISAVSLRKEDLDGSSLYSYPLLLSHKIEHQN